MSTKHNGNLELIIWNFVRNEYENKFSKQYIPIALKHIVMKYSKKIMKCHLLTMKEDLHLYDSLLTKIKSQIKAFRILYKASDNNYSAETFHELCDGKASTLTIIESNFGNVFGGYMKIPWKSEAKPVYDDDAFLFLIRSNELKEQKKCPQMFDIKTSHLAQPLSVWQERGPLFGAGYDISIGGKCNDELPEQGGLNPYEYSYTFCKNESYGWRGHSLSGSDRRGTTQRQYFFQVIDYYVIQVVD